MQQLVKVLTCEPDGSAQVMYIRESACSGDCHKCSGCGAVQQAMIFKARNPIDARPGDLVIIESETGPVLKAAVMLYLLPLVMFIGGYLVGMQWSIGGWLGALGFLLSVGIIIGYDRLVMKKKNTVYTIIGYGDKNSLPNV